ncbi:MAG: hypothetical protein HYX83_02940 [Chloroflexi bacterium]|nr:hypothetical protein [Chloroflexota bacterium]
MNPNEIALEKKLYQFISEYADDPHCLLELLRFWGRHPSARFNRLAIIHALDCQQSLVNKALSYLLDRGVVQGHTESDVTLYSLTELEPVRSLVLSLAKRDLPQYLAASQIYSQRREVYA